MPIQKHSDIDYKKLNYSKPEKLGLIYYAPINYDNEPFYLQTPKMICKSNTLSVLEKKKTNLEMEPLNMDFSFYDALLNLDEKNIKETFKNNKSWFGKDIPLEIIDNMYKRACKPVKKDSKPNFSFKLPITKDKLACQIYDQKKICVDFTKIKEGSEIICILHVKGLKFLKQHYYCDCYISQIKVFLEGSSNYSILDKYAFNDKEEEDLELNELQKEVMLDIRYIESLKENKENKEKAQVQHDLKCAEKELNEKNETVISLRNKLKELN